ncbi:hypothetical protein [Pelagibacterium xiamenense]|uniref:hypothetical protein n=1 Tax=Pelagibacterium xiamenense TaxID=2901140 RepID=UPI001E2D6E08|nr:hypothetical protein [Pelagibacterium xiamenense]MCD7058666.1 hypothetical protein [Pelagibacterium xiamenense]
MIDWIVAHADVINALGSIGMLIVWITYLQVFLYSYRRQVRPKIVINRAAGSALDAHCFVSNMSSDAIYIESVLITLEVDGKTWTRAITDIGDVLDAGEQPEDPRSRTHQRPLMPGSYYVLGSFDTLINSVAKAEYDGAFADDLNGPIHAEVMIIADYASEDLPIGAKRRFKADWRGTYWYLYPETIHTTQIRSRRKRRRIIEMIADHP